SPSRHPAKCRARKARPCGYAICARRHDVRRIGADGIQPAPPVVGRALAAEERPESAAISVWRANEAASLFGCAGYFGPFPRGGSAMFASKIVAVAAFAAAVVSSASTDALAWGGRGHRIVAAVAAQLIPAKAAKLDAIVRKLEKNNN